MGARILSTLRNGTEEFPAGDVKAWLEHVPDRATVSAEVDAGGAIVQFTADWVVDRETW